MMRIYLPGNTKDPTKKIGKGFMETVRMELIKIKLVGRLNKYSH